MRVSLHLTLDGQCRAAFQNYQRILGGTMTTLLTYGESPMASQVDGQWHGRILHAGLLFGECELTGVDLLPNDYQKPRGFFVTFTVERADKGQEIFAALAEEGQVRLPFGTTFWSPGFGVRVDRYGTPWEIDCEQPIASA